MNQDDAIGYADEMARAVATFHQNEGQTVDKGRIDQFQGAAVCQLFEVIPDQARAVVLSLAEFSGLPLFVAVDGNRFYKVAFDDFDFDGSETPVVWCEMTRVDPETGVFKMEAVYDSGTLPLVSRQTAWTFNFGDNFHLSLTTRVDAGANPDDAEEFARSLAEAMGWPGVNPLTRR